MHTLQSACFPPYTPHPPAHPRPTASSRCLLTYTPSEGLPALQVLGRVIHEQALLYYATDAQVSGSVGVCRCEPGLHDKLVLLYAWSAQVRGRAVARGLGCVGWVWRRRWHLGPAAPLLALQLVRKCRNACCPPTCPRSAASGCPCQPQPAICGPQLAHRIQGGASRAQPGRAGLRLLLECARTPSDACLPGTSMLHH